MTLNCVPLATNVASFADRLKAVLFDVGLPPDLPVVGLFAVALLFAAIGFLQRLWRWLRSANNPTRERT